MKYLKLFESFDDRLWLPVDEREFSQRQSTFGPDVPPSDNDKNAIRGFFHKNWAEPPLYKPKYVNWDFELSSSGNQIEISITNESGIGDKRFQLIINKSPDDWFWVKEYYYIWHQGVKYSTWRQMTYPNLDNLLTYESYYKCDSMEGLLDLVKCRREFLYKD